MQDRGVPPLAVQAVPVTGKGRRRRNSESVIRQRESGFAHPAFPTAVYLWPGECWRLGLRPECHGEPPVCPTMGARSGASSQSDVRKVLAMAVIGAPPGPRPPGVPAYLPASDNS